jgi:hypothetical protein
MEKWDQVKSSHVVFFVEDSFFGSEKAKEKSDKYKWEIWNSDEKVKITKNRINGIPFDITWVFHSEKTGYGLQVNGEKNVAAAARPYPTPLFKTDRNIACKLRIHIFQ